MASSLIPMMSVLECSSLKTRPKNKNNTTTSTSSTNNNRTSTGSTTSNNKKQQKQKQKQQQQKKPGKFGYFGKVVLKDVEYMKRNISRGFEWANRAFRMNEISKTLDDFIWFRNLEDTNAVSYRFPTWPIPQYAELTGVDLLAADLKALEAYMTYFFYLSKMWTKPLPEVYDPQEVADYFNCRPHVVALRLLEVFASFAAAAIKIRTSAIRTRYSSSVNKDDDQSISQYNYGMVLKETMLNLGPTFIKVGQSLATRPDIIGSEITKALSELHDQIPPFPRTLAVKIIEEELGSPVETFFSYLSPEPVAAASFGQVYRGRTIDGSNVAVKVQRPNMRHVVVRDVYILRLGLGLFRRIAKRKSDLRLYADELGKGLVGELDYTLEAANALEFMDAHSQFTFISVPKVFRHLSRKKVLTMEWMAGESPSDLVYRSSKRSVDRDSNFSERQQSEARRHLLDLVNKGAQATLVQLLETGVLHGDPHPGNLRYTPSGHIGFLDFGLLCRMKKKHQFAMLASIIHIVNGDWASLVQSLDEMDVVSPGTSIRRVTMDLEDSLGEVEFKDGMPDVKFSRVLSKIWVVAYKFHFRMPPYFTVLLRSLASLEGLAVVGDPNFKTFESAYPYVVRKLLTDNSADMRRILHSVVFNRRKEFQWKKLALFLRIGATRKGISLASDTYVGKSPEGPTSVFEVTNLVMRMVQSKDGVVLRRLLMTANGASLIRAMVSKEAVTFRQELCRMIADTLYKSICESLEGNLPASQYVARVRLAGVTENIQKSSSSRLSIPIFGYNSILKDRRLKVIFLNALESARKEPTLILRFCWASAVMFLAASALACHRVVVSLSEVYLGPVSFSQKQFVVGS